MVSAIRDLLELGTGQLLTVIENGRHAISNRIRTVLVGQGVQLALADDTAGELRADITHTIAWHANVGENHVHIRLLDLASLIQLDRRNTQTFLQRVGSDGGIAAGAHSPDVGPVTADHRKTEHLAIGKNRFCHHAVG